MLRINVFLVACLLVIAMVGCGEENVKKAELTPDKQVSTINVEQVKAPAKVETEAKKAEVEQVQVEEVKAQNAPANGGGEVAKQQVAPEKKVAKPAEIKAPEKVSEKVKKPSLEAKKEVSQAKPKLPELRQNAAQKRAFFAETTTIDGKKWSASDYRGKVILIDFWATWCPGCKPLEPAMREIYDKHKDNKDFVMVGVALDKSASKVRKYCKQKDITWPQLHEPGKTWDNSLTRAFGVESIPMIAIIKKDGSMEQLQYLEQIDNALNE